MEGLRIHSTIVEARDQDNESDRSAKEQSASVWNANDERQKKEQAH
jgi:hypothetical protein